MVAFFLGLAVAYGLCRPRRVRTLDDAAVLAYSRLQSGRDRIRFVMVLVSMVLFFVALFSLATR